MAWWWRAGLLLVGSFAFLWGTCKAYFEIKAWEVMVRVGQRAPEVDGQYRVYVRLHLFLAALGLTLVALGCLL